MKFLSLVWKSTAMLFRRNRVAFVIFLAVQTVVSLGFIFFFTTTFTARGNYLRNYDSMRTIEADFTQSVSGLSVSKLPQKLAGNPVMTLENIQYTFLLNSEKSKENPREFIAYRHPDEFKNRIVGAGITKQQIAEKSPVIISGNLDRAMDPKVVWYHAGDTELLDGLKLKVIGTYRSTDSYGEIPYTFGFAYFLLKKIQLRVPANATDNQKEQLGQYLKSLLPESTIKVPKPLTQKVLSNMIIPYAAGLVTGVSALINLLFIFKYMLESSRQDYFVYRVCGCGRRKMFALLSCELFSMYTLCFVVGALMFSGLRKVYISNAVFAGSSLKALHVLLLYASSLIVIALAMVPYFIRYRRQSVNSGGAL